MPGALAASVRVVDEGHRLRSRGVTLAVMTPGPRFLTLADVAETLNISAAQAYALVRNGELPAIKIGGRGQWRVEAAALEDYIERLYRETRDFVSGHPLGRAGGDIADAERPLQRVEREDG